MKLETIADRQYFTSLRNILNERCFSPSRWLLPVWIIMLSGLSGCVWAKNDQAFYDSIDAHAANHVPSPAPGGPKPAPQLAKADFTAINQLIFSHLLEHHFQADDNFSAIFLQADQDIEAEFVKQYQNHVPPVKAAYRAYLPKNQTPIDRDTGKPAMILSAEINDPETDGSVIALGRWYAGGAIAGFYTFTLDKQDDRWIIKHVK